MENIKSWYKNNKKIVLVSSIIFIFTLIYILNYNTIYAADDYSFYNNVWNNNQKFDFSYIFNKTLSFYFAWTGRFVSTFLNYIFLALNKNIFNIFNTSIFILYIYLIYNIVKKKNETNPLLLLLIFFIVWLFIPQFGEVMLWKIGSVIYLWTMTSVLFVTLMFINLLKNQSRIKDGIISSILMLIFSIIAGNGFETNSLMLIAITTIILFYIIFVNKQKIPIWSIASYIGVIAGSFSNFLSPGNAVRMNSMGSSGSIFSRMFDGLGIFFYRGIIETKIYILVSIIIILFVVYLILKQKNIKPFLNKSVLIIFIEMIAFITILISSSVIIGQHTLSEFLGWFYPNAKLFAAFIAFLSILLLIIIISCYVFKKKLFINTVKETNFIIISFFLAAMFGICSYLATPVAWPRSYMGMSTFLIIVLCFLIRNLNINFKINITKHLVVAIFVFIFLLFSSTYIRATSDIIDSKEWSKKTENYIYRQINKQNNYILVKTYMSENTYNAASVEKWVIPAIIKNGTYVTNDGINIDYEWINIAVTNYYFKDNNSWSEGKRILGYE